MPSSMADFMQLALGLRQMQIQAQSQQLAVQRFHTDGLHQFLNDVQSNADPMLQEGLIKGYAQQLGMDEGDLRSIARQATPTGAAIQAGTEYIGGKELQNPGSTGSSPAFARTAQEAFRVGTSNQNAAGEAGSQLGATIMGKTNEQLANNPDLANTLALLNGFKQVGTTPMAGGADVAAFHNTPADQMVYAGQAAAGLQLNAEQKAQLDVANQDARIKERQVESGAATDAVNAQANFEQARAQVASLHDKGDLTPAQISEQLTQLAGQMSRSKGNEPIQTRVMWMQAYNLLLEAARKKGMHVGSDVTDPDQFTSQTMLGRIQNLINATGAQ